MIQLETNSFHEKTSFFRTFFDQDSILQVGGRLRKYRFVSCKGHPILLPAYHITKILFYPEHNRLLPISGKSTEKNVVRECIRYFRVNRIRLNQL